ncbi:protein-L-isoaspartate O-methyltransferase family protein [Paradevosia shaoguanensis]|uniref:Protein-L-isoaspartate O-methyltransferase n=1 Tax=Paradevosia shaoguanensis TaxID=1335043 RepID=A0AA41QMA6_9HYPH|nr:protein-L-isoaspartate O-methyltransferase [Paradevosia shaoguanensis]MCF1742647.1 protein-L-isoaspartate O-methyltransferase [Paradevosia shaoguanensis]MCI0127130.1 protein-L-isoaspartate O-methyltransferase [Paradevosia shaoguanensis]
MVDFARARAVMVDNQVRTSNVNERRLLAVLGQVPRERFVPESRRALAYIDEAIPLLGDAGARYLAPPAPFAKLVQLADIQGNERVLEIGAGTGYTTAVLAGLAREVVGVEPNAELATAARDNLQGLGIENARIVENAFDAPLKGEGHFDVVFFSGSVRNVPDSAFTSLRDGGRLVVLVLGGLTGTAHVFVKVGKDIASRAEFNTNIPALPMAKAPEQFVF